MFSKQRLYEGENLTDFRELIERYHERYAQKTAFRFKKSPKDTQIISISYEDFYQDIRSLSTSLLELGLRKKRIAIIAPNRYEWCTSYLAITASDIVVVPFDKALPENELIQLLERSKADAIFFDHQYLSIFTRSDFPKSLPLQNLICMDPLSKEEKETLSDYQVHSYQDLIQNGKMSLERGSTEYDSVSIDPDQMSIMLFTSGTTSISKAVMLSQHNICADIYALSQMAKVTQEDTFLSFLPLHHTFESSCTFLYGSSCGITIAFCDGIRYAAQNLKEYEVTGFVCVPLMLEAIYKKIQKGIEEQKKTKLIHFARKLSRFLLFFHIDIRRKLFKQILDQLGGKLRILIAGGAPMNPEVIDGYLSFGINLLQGYGLTETSPVLAGENDQYKRLGSVGFPLPGIEIAIDNPDPETGVGEIKAKGPTIMLGYYKNEEATKSALRDGWFYTGDLGYIDQDDFLFVTGRKKDVIVLKNGKNIYPEELEILINQLPFVEESFVFGQKQEDDDYKLYAEIVYSEKTMQELYPNLKVEEYEDFIWKEVKEKVNHTMPAYKAIRKVLITTEPLIKTTTQKVKRHEELKKVEKQFKL